MGIFAFAGILIYFLIGKESKVKLIAVEGEYHFEWSVDELAEKRIVKKEGIVFLVVTLILFLSMSFLSLRYGYLNFNMNQLSIWVPIILIFSSAVFSFQNYKSKRTYYAYGHAVVCLALLVFILIPQFITM
ncbi:hypothetical protein [Robertmurraya sp. Marseille-Q9965]